MTTLCGVKPYYSILHQNGNELHDRKSGSCDAFYKRRSESEHFMFTEMQFCPNHLTWSHTAKLNQAHL